MTTTRARIMGRDIELNIEEIDELSFSAIVSYVNEEWQKMQEENSNVPDTQKIAALTAVKIAADLLKTKRLQDNISDSYERKINDLIKKLDEAEYPN
ncbi:MAG: cell division protein ZapA [Endomicrobia bacterium]|nr:cell division protein ZapA [Endomicrobiia bacterium]